MVWRGRFCLFLRDVSLASFVGSKYVESVDETGEADSERDSGVGIMLGIRDWACVCDVSW